MHKFTAGTFQCPLILEQTDTTAVVSHSGPSGLYHFPFCFRVPKFCCSSLHPLFLSLGVYAFNILKTKHFTLLVFVFNLLSLTRNSHFNKFLYGPNHNLKVVTKCPGQTQSPAHPHPHPEKPQVKKGKLEDGNEK